MNHRFKQDLTIEIIHGDILSGPANVIVNPCNPQLKHGGGVCGLIYKQVMNTGPHNYRRLIKETRKLGKCNYGQAVATNAPGLHHKLIVHTVGARSDRHNLVQQQQIIYSCFHESLKIADINHMHSIAFPMISTGIYGCNKSLVSKCFIKACNDFLNETFKAGERHLKVIKMIVSNQTDLSLF